MRIDKRPTFYQILLINHPMFHFKLLKIIDQSFKQIEGVKDSK